MKFSLFKEVAELGGIELIMLIAALLVLSVLIFLSFRLAKAQANINTHVSKTKKLVFAAMCVGVAFVLSYIKLFSMPMGGSVTLCSMLPLMLFSAWFGPLYGYLACFVYGLLQIVQGAYFVHWAQFALDYFIAFTIIGTAGFFRDKKIPIGIIVAGILRMLSSTLSGAVFFAEYAQEAGWSNAWLYSLVYNLSTIGVDTLLCFVIYIIPGICVPLTTLSKKIVGE